MTEINLLPLRVARLGYKPEEEEEEEAWQHNLPNEIKTRTCK